MVIKRTGRGFSYDVTGDMHTTTVEKKAAVGKNGLKNDIDFRLEATFLGESPGHVVKTDIGQGLKKTLLDEKG